MIKMHVYPVRWLTTLVMVLLVFSGCDLLGSTDETDDTNGNNGTPTETAIGFFDGFISGSAADIVGLVPLTAGVEYRVELSRLTADVSFAVREGTPTNIGTVIVGAAQNNGSSSVSVSFTATRRNYVAGLNLVSGSGTSYSLTTYEIR